MEIDKKIKDLLNKENYGISISLAKKYNFNVNDIWRQDAIFIHSKELQKIKNKRESIKL